ncbi:MAG: PKD domain-containing protein, partial [Chloroflexi bacterium]|nr:PKD domain-containing protein [Chloroflexota bacterium]
AGGSNVAYNWNLGDGSMGSGASLEHIYPAEGVYTAVVTASNSISQLSASTVITVDQVISGLVASNGSPVYLIHYRTLFRMRCGFRGKTRIKQIELS